MIEKCLKEKSEMQIVKREENFVSTFSEDIESYMMITTRFIEYIFNGR